MKIEHCKEFQKWLARIDTVIRGKVESRLGRIEKKELFGSAKHISGKLSELRWKTGTRVYFFRKYPKTVFLLWGGKKNDQKRDIKRAKDLLRKYDSS